MIIEIKKNKILINGEETFEQIFNIKQYSKRNIIRELDFRNSKLNEVEDLIIINKSGRNYDLISINDWDCTLRTSQKVKIKKGFIPYMSQTTA